MISAKTGAGESDLQATNIQFEDYTFLKEAENRHAIKVYLWERTQGSRSHSIPISITRTRSGAAFSRMHASGALYRLPSTDARSTWRRSSVSAMTAPILCCRKAHCYRREYAEAWITHDPARANAMLDEMGLDKRDDDGWRLLPDGRTAQVIVESAGESTLDTDVLELIADYWREIGIPLYIRTSQVDVLRSRALAGQVMMSISYGIDNGHRHCRHESRAYLAPTGDEQLQWPIWGVHYVTRGEKGRTPISPRCWRC